jgi:hypothetical protein
MIFPVGAGVMDDPPPPPATLIDSDAVAVWAGAGELAVAPNPLWPAAVGMPEMTPVEASSDSPAGSEPKVIDQLLSLPPLVCSVAL